MCADLGGVTLKRLAFPQRLVWLPRIPQLLLNEQFLQKWVCLISIPLPTEGAVGEESSRFSALEVSSIFSPG